MSISDAPVVIIGIGNSMRQDDAIGPAVIEACERDPIAGCELVTLDGETTRLLDAWRGRQLAVVVDAVSTGAPPGTVHDLGADVLISIRGSGSRASSHNAGLAEAIELGTELGRLPLTLRVVGIEPAELAHGSGMSRAVVQSIPSLVALVRSVALHGLAHPVSGVDQ